MNRIKIFLFSLILLSNSVFSQTPVPLWKTLPDVPQMPTPEKSGLAPVNDIKMYYALFNLKGPEPVILLHGGFGSSDVWGFEVPLLSKTHQVLLVDSRAHGRSSGSDKPLSYDLMANDVIHLMDYLKISKASIVGWSDGGIIGLIIAIKYPSRINNLFTYGANYNHSGDKDEPQDSALAARFMAKAQADYRKLSPTPGNFNQLKASLRKLYQLEPNLNPEDLKTIKAPTVIGAGEHEQFFTLEHFKALAQLIPRGKLVILPNVSHAGPWQDPTAFHKAVVNLLDNK